MDEITARLYQLIVEKLGIDQADIRDDASFIGDYHIDSLDLFEFIMAVEKTFDIAIPDETADKITTPGQFIDYIHSQKKIE